jgi:hypothetical protein
MNSTDEASKVLPEILDIRQVPLAEVLTPVTLDQALQCVIPDIRNAPVPTAASNSAF